MTKKDIKAFFKAITDSDLSGVAALINTNNEYLTVCNMAPPRKDDGQSGLQVAFKTGSFAIAQFLIEQGANVNFIESSTINEWRAPVLHDCIRAIIFNTYTLQKDTAKFDSAFPLLQLMLSRNANPNAIDSYGNNCLSRAIMDARQMIDHPDADLANGILLQQLRRVFKALIDAGADTRLSNEKRPGAVDLLQTFKLEQYQLW